MNDTVQIQVDAGKTCGELEHIWRYIGYDECNYTYIPEGLEQLRKFGALPDAPYYVRTHFTFCTGNCHGSYKYGSTNIYTEDENGNPVYDFEIYDKIIDALLANNAKPFVELGFMPMDLVDFNFLPPVEYEWSRYGQYKESGWSCPPKDYEKWHGLIRNLMEHLVSKYGRDEVVSWYFELWNEPDINYWKGSREEYCKLFDYTENALHGVLPEAQLAGPATTGILDGGNQREYFEFFLDHCKNGKNEYNGGRGTRLDYITFHVKGGGFTFDVHAKPESPSVLSLVNQVRNGLDSIKKYGYDSLEVVLSEADPDGWAAGGLYDNANMNFRNTEYYATYIASAYHKIMMVADSYGMKVRPLAWAFLFPGERCFEGTRTFSTQGIDKAVFNAFRILSRLGTERLELVSSGSFDLNTVTRATGNAAKIDEIEVSGFAARGASGQTQIVLYTHHDNQYFEGSKEVSLSVCGLEDAKVFNVKQYRIDGEHSNAYAEWLRQGRPWYPDEKQYRAIKACEGLTCISEETVSVKGGKLSFGLHLPAHSLSLIELSDKK